MKFDFLIWLWPEITLLSINHRSAVRLSELPQNFCGSGIDNFLLEWSMKEAAVRNCNFYDGNKTYILRTWSSKFALRLLEFKSSLTITHSRSRQGEVMSRTALSKKIVQHARVHVGSNDDTLTHRPETHAQRQKKIPWHEVDTVESAVLDKTVIKIAVFYSCNQQCFACVGFCVVC